MLSNKELADEIKKIVGTTKKLSPWTIRKKLSKDIKMRRLIWMLNNSDFRQVGPLEVGSGKNGVLVFCKT